MCSIAAIISKKGPVPPDRLRLMNASLAHRGPDDTGTYLSGAGHIGLGSNRLSLVDLSSNGKQPMTKYLRTVVFNGEIYNFREINEALRQKGYAFSSQSDTETILTAFEEWGIACIQKFNGAFAFVLFDHTNNDVFIVRDRIGEKPLYITETPQYYLFASEIKAFLTVPGVKLSPDIDTIQSHLIFHFFADKESSYFQNIRSLAPGHYIKIHRGRYAEHTYWDVHLSDTSASGQSIPQLVDRFAYLLEDATKIRLAADSEVGTIFSGGIDSSLITVMASRLLHRPLKCFTLRVKHHIDEDQKHAQMVYDAFPNLQHIPVLIDDRIFSLDNLDAVTKHVEEVVLNRISMFVNANYKTVHQHNLKAVLNGQGSDEISLGYYTYYDFMHRSGVSFTYDKFAEYWYRQFALKAYVPKRESLRLIEQNLTKNYLPYKRHDVLNQALAFGIKTHLLNILNHEDRFSMKESVECRTVFTDYRLIEMFMDIPSRLKIYDGREKYLVRKLGERLLPSGVVSRMKMGFPNLPDGHELLVHKILSDTHFKQSELLHKVFSPRIFNDIEKLPDGLQWKLACLYRFEKVFFQ